MIARCMYVYGYVSYVVLKDGESVLVEYTKHRSSNHSSGYVKVNVSLLQHLR